MWCAQPDTAGHSNLDARSGLSIPTDARLYETILAHAGLGLWVWSAGHSELLLSCGASRMLGYPTDQPWVVLSNWQERLTPQAFAETSSHYLQAIAANSANFDLSFDYVRPDLENRRLRSSITVVEWLEAPRRPGRLIGTLRDVTNQRQIQSELDAARTQAKAIFDTVPTGLGIVSLTGEWLVVNSAICQMLGYTSAELTQLTFQQITVPEHLDNDLALMNDCLAGKLDQYTLFKNYLRKDRSQLPIQLNTRLVRDGENTPLYFVSAITDLTERRSTERRMLRLAKTDQLTGLLNRGELEESVRAIQVAIQASQPVSAHLLFIDIDGIVAINDRLGHQMGDRLIRHTAHLIAQHAPPGSVIGRWNGDQFVMIYLAGNEKQVQAFCTTVLQAIFSSSHGTESNIEPYSCSVGIVEIDDRPAEPHAFVLLADYACRAAKQIGGGRAVNYKDVQGDIHRFRAAATIRREIEQALLENTLLVYAQNIYDRERNLVGREVLLRKKELGRVVAIPHMLLEAERIGLIQRIDRYVFDKVFDRLEQNDYQGVGYLCINLSSLTLTDALFAKHVIHRLRSTPDLAKRLRFEITESADITDRSIAKGFLSDLRALGVGLLIDDFGSGFASFGRLRELPVTGIKIDRSYIAGIDSDLTAQDIVRSMIQVAQPLGIEVVAEGVETENEFATVRRLGVNLIQGWLFHKASPL